MTAAVQFVVDGGAPCTLVDFLAANADDQAVCEWARSAKPGDTFPAIVDCWAINTDPGAYYVSVARGTEYRLLAGPFIDNHAAALATVDKARKVAEELDARACWYSFGTCRLDVAPGQAPRQGMLNAQCGVAPC